MRKGNAKKQFGSVSSGIEFYPEKKYNDVERMVSLGILLKENEICDEKQGVKKYLVYDTQDFKKESKQDKTDIVTSTIQDRIWDFEAYKKNKR